MIPPPRTRPPRTGPLSRRSLDALYPRAAWRLPVNPAFPAPRLADPPVERCNLGRYRDYYGPNILREIPVPAVCERLAVIDKAFPHSLFDVMLLVARDDIMRTGIGNTPDQVLAALLQAASAFAGFLSDPAVLRAFGLEGGQVGIAWNHDPTIDRDNGQWWDKRLHLHLNCWPRTVQRTVRPVRLGDIRDPTARRSLVDPVAYLAHQVMVDALHHFTRYDVTLPGVTLPGVTRHGVAVSGAALPAGCEILGPDPGRDAELLLPVGLKIALPGWRFVTTPQCLQLLRTLHDTASAVYERLRRCFTGSTTGPGPWRRPRLLPAGDVRDNLSRLPWLSPSAAGGLVQLRRTLRDVTDREMRLLQDRPDIANRCLSLGGLSYNLSFHTPHPATAAHPIADADDLYLVMQFKLVSYVGSSPAVGGAVASLIDRTHGPVMTTAQRRLRHAFQQAYTDTLTARLGAPLLDPPPALAAAGNRREPAGRNAT